MIHSELAERLSGVGRCGETLHREGTTQATMCGLGGADRWGSLGSVLLAAIMSCTLGCGRAGDSAPTKMEEMAPADEHSGFREESQSAKEVNRDGREAFESQADEFYEKAGKVGKRDFGQKIGEEDRLAQVEDLLLAPDGPSNEPARPPADNFDRPEEMPGSPPPATVSRAEADLSALFGATEKEEGSAA